MNDQVQQQDVKRRTPGRPKMKPENEDNRCVPYGTSLPRYQCRWLAEMYPGKAAKLLRRMIDDEMARCNAKP